MEKEPKNDANHLTAVADLLFDGDELTQEQHLMVVERGLSESIGSDQRAQVLGYASEHVAEPETVRDIQLSVAEKATEGLELGLWRRSNARTYGVPERNGQRIRDAVAIMSEVANSPQAFDVADYKRIFGILGGIQAARPNDDYERDYSAASVGRDLSSFEDEKDRRRGSAPLAEPTGLIKKWTKRLKAATAKRVQKGQYQTGGYADYKRATAYFDTVTELSESFIDRVSQELEDPAEILGERVHEAYLRQAEWLRVRGRYHDSETVDRLIDKAMGHIDADTPDAVEICLALYNNKPLNEDGEALAYSNPDTMLAKAITITKASDKTPESLEMVSRFGFKRKLVSAPSQFETRRSMLEKQLSSKFQYFLEERPEIIAEIIGLYEEETVEGEMSRTDVWRKYAERVAGKGFLNGHYDTDDIQTVRQALAQFGKVAPKAVTEDTERTVRERLITSVPTTSKNRW